MNNLCQCGCRREVTNEKSKFIKGHNKATLGKKHSIETKEKISKSRSSKEAIERYKQTCLERFGTEDPNQLKEIKVKRIQTCLKNHGVDHPMQSEEIQEKGHQTCFKNHGTRFPLQSKDIYDQYKKTCKENYGVENPMQSEEIQEKSKQTCLENYGVEYPIQSEEIQGKIKQACRENYGVENPMQSKEIQEQVRQTNINKFGGPVPYCSEEIREKGQQTCFENYGVNNYSKTFEFRQFARERRIQHISDGLKDGQSFSPMTGLQETAILNEFEILASFKLPIRNSNLISYFPDGRNDEKKIIVEVYEPWHKNTWSIEHDIIRQRDLESLGYRVFVIWQDEWKENKERIIEQFKVLIND